MADSITVFLLLDSAARSVDADQVATRRLLWLEPLVEVATVAAD